MQPGSLFFIMKSKGVTQGLYPPFFHPSDKPSPTRKDAYFPLCLDFYF